MTTDDETDGVIPFHKLSQWLTYSLIEPLQWAGIEIVNLDGLTGLAVYLLDRLAVELRTTLGLSEKRLPLCSVLQGGTSVAGRDLAMRLRHPQTYLPLIGDVAGKVTTKPVGKTWEYSFIMRFLKLVE